MTTLDIPTIRKQFLDVDRPDLGETLAVLADALTEVERVTVAAHQLRHAMHGQHEQVSHAVEVYALGERCEPCIRAAEEANCEYRCEDWRRWQADYQQAITIHLPDPPTTTEDR